MCVCTPIPSVVQAIFGKLYRLVEENCKNALVRLAFLGRHMSFIGFGLAHQSKKSMQMFHLTGMAWMCTQSQPMSTDTCTRHVHSVYLLKRSRRAMQAGLRATDTGNFDVTLCHIMFTYQRTHISAYVDNPNETKWYNRIVHHLFTNDIK